MGLFSFGSGSDLAESVTKKAQTKASDYSNLLNQYLSQTRNALTPFISGGGQGYDPLHLALMKSSLLGNAAQNYGNANTQVMSALARRGSVGQGPVGGDFTRGIAGLQGAQAGTVSSGLSGIEQNNLQQALQNKFGALGLMQGSMGQINNALGSYNQLTGSALNDYIKAMGQSFGGQLMGNLGASMGVGLGGGIGSELSGLMKGGGGAAINAGAPQAMPGYSMAAPSFPIGPLPTNLYM